VVGTEKSVVVTRCKVGGRTSRRRAYCPRSRQIVVIIVGIVPTSTTEFPDEVVSVTVGRPERRRTCLPARQPVGSRQSLTLLSGKRKFPDSASLPTRFIGLNVA